MKRNTVKRNVSLALGAVLVFGAVPAYAADAVTVNLNGSQMEFDVNPVIENSRTLVPFRKIFEALDCAVSYTKENGAQVVTANRGNQWITLEIGKNEITVDGETKKLDVAPKIVNGRTLVPLRAISEGLDCTVDWSADTKTVDIQKKQGQYAVTSAHISKNITVAKFYCDNLDVFEKLRQELSKRGIEYPPMKLMDMCFWQDAYLDDLKQK